MVKVLNKPIGLLGGSFDPAHKGHLAISKIAIKKIKLEKVYWIVSRKNPFKKKPHFSLSERMTRAKKLTSKINKIKVIYLDKTLKSSRIIKNIYFIIGSDNLIKFHKWKSWKKIVKLTKLVVFSRKGYDKKSKKSVVAKYLKNKFIFINNKPIIISSTKLRSQTQLKY